MKAPRYNVIIADDFEHEIELIALALRRTNHFSIVSKARDGKEVVDYLVGKPPYNDREIFPLPQLLLLDLKMLKMDGFQVLRWISTNNFPVVTFVVTGYDIEGYADLARDLGASAVFFKPISREDTKQIIVLAEQFIEAVQNPEGH